MKLLVLQETDWVKRAPHHQYNPTDRLRQVLTGGVQFDVPVRTDRIILGTSKEETCILGVPCVTLRDNTERPETVEVGSNMLAGTEPEGIIRCARSMLVRSNDWKNPFGDGKAAERIVRVMAMVRRG